MSRVDERRIAAEQLRARIAEGLASGAPAPADGKYWSAKRKQLLGEQRCVDQVRDRASE
jgi:hypothetical protein